MILPPAVALIATEMIFPPAGGNNSQKLSDIDTGVDSIMPHAEEIATIT